LIGVTHTPNHPKTSVITNFNIDTYDNKSGIECVYIYLSKNNFTDYTCYGSSNSIKENKELFSINSEKLTPGRYSYFIIVRDYANNTIAFQDSSFSLFIPIPLMNYISIVSMITIVGVIGVSGFVIYKGLKKDSRIIKEQGYL
ncbi:MAG: hypothetical protein ACFFB9_17225, partial [Promethearchaeota archaeon]